MLYQSGMGTAWRLDDGRFLGIVIQCLWFISSKCCSFDATNQLCRVWLLEFLDRMLSIGGTISLGGMSVFIMDNDTSIDSRVARVGGGIMGHGDLVN